MAPERDERPRPTLADVAGAAGVSTSTASRALHGGAGVSDGLSARVRGAALALGYHVNVQARSLRRGRDQAIGLAVEDFTIPFFGRIVAAVERSAHQRGYALLITVAGPGRSEAESVEPLLSRSLSGLVVASGTAGAPEGYLAGVADRLPLVQVDAVGASPFSDTVGIDNHLAGRRLTEHLLAHGHRDVLFVGSGAAASTVVLRQAGYAAAMADAGLSATSAWLGYEPTQVPAAAAELLARHRHVTAVASGVARTTLGTVSALERAGRHDVAFAAIDDLAGADALGLTVLEQDVEVMATTAARLLFERIDGVAGSPRHVETPLQLRPRGSGERPPSPPAREPPRGGPAHRSRPGRPVPSRA